MTEEKLEQAKVILNEINRMKRILKEKNLYIWNGAYSVSCGHASYTNDEFEAL